MKKLTQAVLVSLLMPLVLLTGCAGTEQGGIMPDNPWTIKGYTRELGNVPGLDAETEWRILRDYLRPLIEHGTSIDINKIYINRYYGTHNGFVIVGIFDPFVPIAGVPSRPFEIDGIVFPWNWPSPSFPAAWSNGRFYGIVQLFASGLLTRDDLLNIAQHGQSEDGN